MDLLSRANRLAVTLGGDPAACCPLCLASLAEDLSNGVTERQLDRLRTDAHPFWDACINAVIKLSDSTSSSLAVLNSMAATCPRQHDPPNASKTDAVRVVAAASCRILFIGLSIGAHSAVGRASKSRTAFASSRGYWPTDAAQLFPGGPHSILRALVQWERTTQWRAPIAILADLLTTAHPFVFNTIMTTPQLHADLLALLVDRLRGGIAAEELDSLPLQIQEDVRPVSRKQAVAAVVAFLAVLLSGPDAGADDVLRLLRPRAEEIFHIILSALVVVDGPHEEQYKTLAVVANQLQKHLGLPISLLPPRAVAFRGPELGIVDVIVVLLNTVRSQKRRRCSGPRCGLYAQEHDGPFQRCAGCAAVYYCNRECQLRDWQLRAGERVRHKQVCATIAKLLDVQNYFSAYAACSHAERTHVLRFALAHTALHDELRQRALGLVAAHHSVGARALGALPLHVGMHMMQQMLD